jgi:hypothetical protein
MRNCVSFLALLLVVQVAMAGENPNVRIHLDFDPPNGATRIDPDPGDEFDVYVVLDCFGDVGGFTGLDVCIERTFGGSVVTLGSLVGSMQMGHVENPTIGWMLATDVGCLHPGPDGLLVVGRVTYEYEGPPGWLRVTRPQSDGGVVGDCDVELDHFCVSGNAGVGMSAPPPEAGCLCGASPVLGDTWGAVKALYR